MESVLSDGGRDGDFGRRNVLPGRAWRTAFENLGPKDRPSPTVRSLIYRAVAVGRSTARRLQPRFGFLVARKAATYECPYG